MRIVLILLAIGVLAGCGSKQADAAAACEKEIAAKMGDKKYVVDSKDMSANAANEDGDIIRIQSNITIDPGLPREDKQTFECRVRFTDGRADVISMSFTW